MSVHGRGDKDELAIETEGLPFSKDTGSTAVEPLPVNAPRFISSSAQPCSPHLNEPFNPYLSQHTRSLIQISSVQNNSTNTERQQWNAQLYTLRFEFGGFELTNRGMGRTHAQRRPSVAGGGRELAAPPLQPAWNFFALKSSR